MYSAYAKVIQVWFIGCPNHSEQESWHFATSISRHSQIDRYYLKILIEYGFKEPKQECTYIAHPTSKTTLCGMY